MMVVVVLVPVLVLMLVFMLMFMLVMIFMLLPQAQVSAERISEVLERKANIREGSVSECKEHGTVEFKNVSFSLTSSPSSAARRASSRPITTPPSLTRSSTTGTGTSLITAPYCARSGCIQA